MDIQDVIKGTVRSSFHDYAGSRCCFLNMCVISGYVLAQQTVEKLLKAIVYEHSGAVKSLGKGTGHNLLIWLEHAIRVKSKLLELNQHVALLKLLTEAYAGKYADSKVQPGGLRSSNQIEEIDVLVSKLLQEAPYPAFFMEEFVFASAGAIFPTTVWITYQNPTFVQMAERRVGDIGERLLHFVQGAASLSPNQVLSRESSAENAA